MKTQNTRWKRKTPDLVLKNRQWQHWCRLGIRGGTGPPDPECLSRLRQDSAFLLWIWSQKFGKNRTRSHFSIFKLIGPHKSGPLAARAMSNLDYFNCFVCLLEWSFSHPSKLCIVFGFGTLADIQVPCKRRSSVNSGAWLRRFDDVTWVAKTDLLRWAMRTKRL